MHFVVSFGNVTNGWSSTAAYPSFGDDYWFRATANFGGIWWNSSKEAVYELLHVDAEGAPTTGDTTYRMTFAADALPSPSSTASGRSPSTASPTTCWSRTQPAATTSAPRSSLETTTTARSP